MTVRCAICGEEMLGAVNRCWKCGQKLVANPEQPELPPLRTSAKPELVAIDAEVLVSEADDSTAVVSDGEVSVGGEPPVAAPPSRMLPSIAVTSSATSGYRYPADHPTAATGGAYGSLVLGIVGLIASVFTAVAAVLAIFGLALGAWGSSSNRRGTARIGMILCGLALLICSFNGAVWTYTITYGHSPWESAPEGIEEEADTSWEE